MASNHKVLITAIPHNLPKDTLISKLLNFGDMVTIFVSDTNPGGGKRSGYVVYKTKLECYRAIAELNGQPPCYLKMHYGGVVIDETNYDVKRQVSVCLTPHFQRTQAQNSHTSERVSRQLIQSTWGQTVWGEVVEKNDQTSRWEHGLERARDRRYSKGLRNRDGYVPGDIATGGLPDFMGPHEFESAALGRRVVWENGDYAGQSEETGDRCLYCGEVGDNDCEKCGATYCSEICLRKDWSKHKYECKAMIHDGKASSPGSEKAKHKQSPGCGMEEKSQRKTSVQSRSVIMVQSESLQYDDELGGESGDSSSWSSITASVDEEIVMLPKSKKKFFKKQQGKMCCATTRGGIARKDAVDSDLNSGKKDDLVKYGSNTPKVAMGRKNSVDGVLVTKEKDCPLNYGPITQKGAMGKRKSVESDLGKRDDFVVPRSNSSTGAIPKRNVVVRDSPNEKEREYLKSCQSKNGVIKKSPCFNDNHYDETSEVTLSGRTIAGAQVTNNTSGKDSRCSARVNAKSSVQRGNNFTFGGASISQHDNFSGPQDESIEQQGHQESGSTKPHSSGCTPPLMRKLEKLLSLQKQQKMKNEAKNGHKAECTDNLNKLVCEDEKISSPKVTDAELSQLLNRIRTIDINNIQGTKNSAENAPKSLKEWQSEVSPKVEKVTCSKITEASLSPVPNSIRTLDQSIIQGTKNHTKCVPKNGKEVQAEVSPEDEKISSPKVTDAELSQLLNRIRTIDINNIQGTKNSAENAPKSLKEWQSEVSPKDEKVTCSKITEASLPPVPNSIRTLDQSIIQGTKNHTKCVPKNGNEVQAEVSPEAEEVDIPKALTSVTPLCSDIRKMDFDTTQDTKCDSKGAGGNEKEIPSLLSVKCNLPPVQELLSPKLLSSKLSSPKETSPNFSLTNDLRESDLDTIRTSEYDSNYVWKNEKEIPSLLSIKLDFQPNQELLSPKETAPAMVFPLPNDVKNLDLKPIQSCEFVDDNARKNEKEIPSLLSIKVQLSPEMCAMAEAIVDACPEAASVDSSASITQRGWNLASNDPQTQIVNYDLCTQQKKISTEAYLKVVVLSMLKHGEYWVQSVDKEELNIIQKHLINKKKTSQALFQPEVGGFCCVHHDDNWCRGRILSLNVAEIMVVLIDFGKIVPAQPEQLDPLPPIAKNFYAQAIRIKLDPRTPAQFFNCKVGDILDVKSSGVVQEGVTKVQLKGILYAHEVAVPKKLSLAADDNKEGGAPSNAEGSQWPSSVLCQLKEGDEVSCSVISQELSEEEYRDRVVVVIGCETGDIESIAVDLQSDCVEKPADSEFNPSVGEMVAAFSSRLDCWVRSIVMDAGHKHWLVACFDFGFLEEVTEIRDIPVDKVYRKVLAYSAELVVTKSLFSREDLFCEGRIEPEVNLFAKVLKKKDDFLECKLGSSEGVTYCFVEARAWSLKPDCSVYDTSPVEKILPSPTLGVVTVTSGCQVKISTYYDSLVIYVQPCDAESVATLNSLNLGLHKAAVKSGALKDDPVKGKIYICRYSGDMKHYRAIVQRIKSPKEIFIRYIDYGNEETVPKERLFELPPEFDKIPCYGVKIELKKDFDNTLNKDAKRYLHLLTVDKRKLILKFSDGNLRSAELFINGTSLSDNLKKILDP